MIRHTTDAQKRPKYHSVEELGLWSFGLQAAGSASNYIHMGIHDNRAPLVKTPKYQYSPRTRTPNKVPLL